MRSLIIAEAGINHNGNIEIAKRLIDVATMAGADIVKFQTFKADSLASKHAKKAEYQTAGMDDADNQVTMLKRLELLPEQHIKLMEYCKAQGIIFLSTPFDLDSIDILESMNIPFWKIPSGEITNLPYLIKIAKTGKDIILSSGMSDIEEIRSAVTVLKENGVGEITVLHCNTEYPTPFQDVNLRAMGTIRRELGVNVGYSDHTLGIEVAIAAVAMGAIVIEKHFTLDKNMEGPDHSASLEPDELAAMISAIRNVEAAMGDRKKAPSLSERKNIDIVRKSIVAKRCIKAGDRFNDENITTKRPGNGISPMRWFDVLKQTAKRDFEKDELIEL